MLELTQKKVFLLCIVIIWKSFERTQVGYFLVFSFQHVITLLINHFHLKFRWKCLNSTDRCIFCRVGISFSLSLRSLPPPPAGLVELQVKPMPMTLASHRHLSCCTSIQILLIYPESSRGTQMEFWTPDFSLTKPQGHCDLWGVNQWMENQSLSPLPLT